ncbi:MAG: TIM barrel protein [Oscillospiraceae bacterium]|nr:TIM barrel protein [Oscillospiraceae bacterium]
MINFSVCIEMIFSHLPFNERPAAVAAAGLDAVEIWGFAGRDLDEFKDILAKAGVKPVGMCVGTFNKELSAKYGETALLTRESEDVFKRIAMDSVKAAEKMGVKTLIVTVGQERDDLTRYEQHTNIVLALRGAADIFESAGVTAVVEPLNTLHDHKGYYLSSGYEGFSIIREVASPSVKLLYDVYHQQIMEGNLIPCIRGNIDLIGHFHIADTPGRKEPGTGEINFANVFKTISESGYAGYPGLEYVPSADAAETLRDTCRIAGVRG